MSHVYKASEWESPSGRWYVNDTSDLANDSGLWYLPARMLGLDPADYLVMIKEKFNGGDFYYSKRNGFVSFSFESQKDARAFKNFINREAKKRNFLV